MPEYFEYTPDLESVDVDIDGQTTKVPLGSLVKIDKYFKVLKLNNQRVNVIGYTNKKHKNEAELVIKKSNMLRRYSIDKKGKTYRVEFYDTTYGKKGTYVGMFLVEFTGK